MIKQLVRVVRQVDIAHRHQEMAVAAKPGGVCPVERDDEILGSFRVHLVSRRSVELCVEIEEPFVGFGLAVAIQVETDHAEVKRYFDVRRLDLGERRLGRGEVARPSLEESAQIGITYRLGRGIHGDGKACERQHFAGGAERKP